MVTGEGLLRLQKKIKKRKGGGEEEGHKVREGSMMGGRESSQHHSLISVTGSNSSGSGTMRMTMKGTKEGAGGINNEE